MTIRMVRSVVVLLAALLPVLKQDGARMCGIKRSHILVQEAIGVKKFVLVLHVLVSLEEIHEIVVFAKLTVGKNNSAGCVPWRLFRIAARAAASFLPSC